MRFLNGLDLFSGIGGLTLALKEWVRPIAYCEIEDYAQRVLLSRMYEGHLPIAPIWDDINTLSGDDLPEIDIIYGGFPCQDLSVAGHGKGLEGKRSGLFFQICRLVKEIKPGFIFLENVPAIRTRGLRKVVNELAGLGYDCRWTRVSAAELGAPHVRQRWFLLAHSTENGWRQESENNGRNTEGIGKEGQTAGSAIGGKNVANSSGEGLEGQWRRTGSTSPEEPVSASGSEDVEYAKSERWKATVLHRQQGGNLDAPDSGWWKTEPNVGRVADGILSRVDRIKCLGNAVVPQQAEEAFKRLMGIEI